MISLDVTWPNLFERKEKNENENENDDSDDETPEKTIVETPNNDAIEQQENDDEKPEPRLKLEKSTYGLVQAARAWWKKFTSILKDKLGFEQFENDSCLLKRKNEKGRVFLIVYVDDCFVVGDKDAVKQALDEIKKYFSITRSENIEDFKRVEESRKR